MLQGRCDCGAVQFTVGGDIPPVTQCHCGQCRRFSGHVWASALAEFASVTFQQDEGLVWYASSDFAKRGFCKTCGSSLFYRMNGEDGIGISAGSFVGVTGLAMGKHIFVRDKGDYYEIADGVPQIDTY